MTENDDESIAGPSGGSHEDSEGPPILTDKDTTPRKTAGGAFRGVVGPARRLTGDDQILEMQVLTQKAAAWLLGYASPALLSGNLSVPRERDGSYNAREIVRYYVEDRQRSKNRKPAEQVELEGSAKEIKTRLEAQKLRIQLAEMEKSVVPVKLADKYFSLIGSRLRQFGDVLQRAFGSESVVMLNETLDDIDAAIKQWQLEISIEDDLDEFKV